MGGILGHPDSPPAVGPREPSKSLIATPPGRFEPRTGVRPANPRWVGARGVAFGPSIFERVTLEQVGLTELAPGGRVTYPAELGLAPAPPDRDPGSRHGRKRKRGLRPLGRELPPGSLPPTP